ncbi:macro domain-containing protein [Nocardia sp. JW2]|uniref:macro domain-containing protein n=1 Tax=unclassified Nocardia TaxID=2637762 RepID=UPI0015EF64A6|nr:macro domain-containing protein [Nocardia sp. GTS18]
MTTGKLHHRVGNLFAATDLDAVGHGCNCAGAMGRGIATEFKRRWPEMYEEYRVRCRDGRLTPGSVFVWQCDDVTVYNLGTQAHWRGKATLPAIVSSVGAMLAHADEADLRRIGVPRIGAGLGGLEWSDVEGAIMPVIESHDVEVVVFGLE